MKREEAIEAEAKKVVDDFIQCHPNYKRRISKLDALRFGVRAGYLAAESRWTAVSDRLPPDNIRVLVTRSNGCIETDKLVNDRYMTAFAKPVIAWMPLPEPYKVEEVKDDE